MPLYSNILAKKSGHTEPGDQNAPTSSSSLRLLQDHLISKKRSKQPLLPSKLCKQTDKSQVILEDTLHKANDSCRNPQDDYDPRVPNSYEVLKAEQRKAEEQKVIFRKTAGRLNSNILDVLDKLDSDDYSIESTNKGISIAPPSSIISSSTSDKQKYDDCSPQAPKHHLPPVEKLDACAAAAKMMSKMGYKAGQGLGKDEQGISSPLEVEKSGPNCGRIIQQQPQMEKEQQTTSPAGCPTQVLLLQNMVGPGQVDDDLESETKEECTKYGEVIKCLIYEIPNKRVPDDEAVRIFVEFKSPESAVKASNDLNGRYFGGRVVRASFYNVERFRRYELGP